jgi:hypothetical protein
MADNITKTPPNATCEIYAADTTRQVTYADRPSSARSHRTSGGRVCCLSELTSWKEGNCGSCDPDIEKAIREAEPFPPRLAHVGYVSGGGGITSHSSSEFAVDREVP